MPVFESPVYLQQKAGDLKFGALSTPFAVDWDGDGKQDLIAGNSAGQLAFIRNLTGGEKPSWDSPQLFTVEGQPIRIMAGENGSIQGPAERKWGYTVVTVADWDGDGRLDLIVNSIYGQVEWFRNIGGKDRLALAPARPVRVKWGKKACKPVWNWWEPQENTLVTQWRTTPVAIDWNEDGLMDLVMLDHEGYLAYYERFRDSAGELWLRPGERIFYATSGSVYHPVRGMLDSLAGPLCLNPGKAGRSGRRKICFTDWNGDGRPDLMVDSRNVAWFENKGVREGKVWFEYKGNVSEVQLAGHTTCPTAVYRKGKRLADLVVGAEDGHFYLIENPYNN